MTHVRSFRPGFRFLPLAGLLLLIRQPVSAAFLDSGFGARPVGMGQAFTAIADDSNAPLYNPAGLVQIQWNELSASYSDLFSGLTLYSGNDQVHINQSYLSFVSKPTRLGSFGVSWSNFDTTHLYREDTVILSYARNVGDFVPLLDNMLAFGLNLKYLHRGFTLDSATNSDPVFGGGSTASGYTADAGLLFKPEEGPLQGWRIGLTGQNLTRPNVGFQDTDPVAMEWRLGVAYQNRLAPWIVPTIDFTHSDGVTGVNGGVEAWLFHDMLGLRAGGNRDEADTGLSYYQPINKSFGFRLDYSFSVPFYVEGTSGSHRVAATLYF